MQTDAYKAIPDGTKILVDKKVLIGALEDCWTLLVDVQRQKQLIDDKMKGVEQFEATHDTPGGWKEVGPCLMDYGVPPEIANDLAVMLYGMGETARQACEKILFLRKAAMDKTPVEGG